MHGVSWRSGTHAPQLGIVDDVLFVYRIGWNLGRDRRELAGSTDFSELLGISARCWGVHWGDLVCLGSGTFIVVVQGENFVGITAFRGHRIACAGCAYPAMERCGA